MEVIDFGGRMGACFKDKVYERIGELFFLVFFFLSFYVLVKVQRAVHSLFT